MTDILLSAKNLICKELDSAIKVVVESYARNGSVSEDATQALCNVVEAIFIHGLNDAFFLKGSRYSKYPEPNFWPFVSKFTHRSIRQQITNLKQIKNEVGRARAWIRIVLNENALENYITLLCSDANQIRVFYQKTAFLRDYEKMEALIGYLKALSKVKIFAPANSTFLNTWTPSPLILAGICAGRYTKSTEMALSRHLNDSTNSLENENDTEIGMNALELLDEEPKSDSFDSMFIVGSPPVSKGLDIDVEEDDKSSVYSHLSLLDGGISKAIPLRPNFTSVLSCTPENSDLFSSYRGLPIEEKSSEVIVIRRKARFRRTSRSGGGNSSGDERAVSRSGNAGDDRPRNHSVCYSTDNKPKVQLPGSLSASNLFSYNFESPPEDPTIGEKLSDENACLAEHNQTVNRVSADSGIDQTTENTEKTQQNEIGLKDHTAEVSTSECTKMFLPYSLSEIGGLTERKKSAHFISPSLAIELQHDNNGPSCSSSVGTDFSGPMASFDITLQNYLHQSDAIDYRNESVARENAAFEESSYNSEDLLSTSEILKLDANATQLSMDESTKCFEDSNSWIDRNECTPLNPIQELSFQPLDIERCSDDDVVVVETLASCPSNNLHHLTKIPLEKGLDAQEYRCPSCRRSIGLSFGSFKLCNLDGRYYCEDCLRRGDESIIPSRVVLNWDCRPRAICKASKCFLNSVVERPFIRVDKLNMALYEHSKPMDRILKLRQKLSLVVMYLLSCKQSVAEDVKQRIAPHDYMYTDIHLYSIADLEAVINGSLERRLATVISFCVNHVSNCVLCLQKGFMCELCSSKRVIYPFQTDIVYRCKVCFSVYHSACIVDKECTKCVRRAKYLSTFTN